MLRMPAKKKRVVIMLEFETYKPVRELRRADAVELYRNEEFIEASRILQLQVNVIRKLNKKINKK